MNGHTDELAKARRYARILVDASIAALRIAAAEGALGPAAARESWHSRLAAPALASGSPYARISLTTRPSTSVR